MPSKNEIKTELLRRKAAVESIVAFTRYTYPAYVPEPVHEIIGAALDEVISENETHLIINLPPQVGKSRLGSNSLPAKWLGHHPDLPVMLGSYSAGLAEYHSGIARDIVESAAFAQLYPKIETRQDARSTNFWRLKDHAGFVNAAGIGGPLTGKTGYLGIIDDPFENYEQAQSEVMRQKVWDWYETVFLSRMPRIQVIICTRWHGDDLVGRILNSQYQKENWKVLRVPAIQETQAERDHIGRKMNLAIGEPDVLGRPDPVISEGEDGKEIRQGEISVSPLRQPVELYQARRSANPIVWTTLYQNAPITLDGIVIKREMFEKRLLSRPQCYVWIRYWDKAGTQNGGKRTAGVLLGLLAHPSGIGADIIIANVHKGQWDEAHREPEIQLVAARDLVTVGAIETWIEQEGGSGGKDSAKATIRGLAGFNVQAETVSGEKLVRAQPFIAQLLAGNVYLVADTPTERWIDEYIDEWVSVPNGTFMDQIDGTSGAYAHALVAPLPTQPVVTGERIDLLRDAAHNLPSKFYRGTVRTTVAQKYKNNRYVTVQPGASIARRPPKSVRPERSSID